MPSVLINNVPPSAILQDKPREMDAEVRKSRKEPPVCPTDDETITPKTKKYHKQSLEYVWRTGVAGGLAGSAVCAFQDTGPK